GGGGVVSVAGHLVGRRLRAMIEAFQKGDHRTAAAINMELWPIFKAMFVTTNPIPVKAAVNLMGLEAGPVRPPLREPTEEELNAIRTVLKESGLLS
ncbi:MAG: dihydrodipicolinate synthase family protein, partial [Limnochordales bacterium]